MGKWSVPTVRLNILGGFDLQTGAAAPPLGRKAQGLLAFLALAEGRAVNRERLAALLWDDRQEPQARQSLRQTISAVRKALGKDGMRLLLTEGDGLRLDIDAVVTDAVLFLKHLESGSRDDLTRAANLFQGDLLDQLGSVSESFDSWLDGERHRFRLAVADAVDRLSVEDEGWTASAAARATALLLTALDPLCEPAHRVLIRHFAVNNQTALAQRQFRTLKDILHRELDAEPSPATVAALEPSRKLAPGTDGRSAPAGVPHVQSGASGGWRSGRRLALAGLAITALVLVAALVFWPGARRDAGEPVTAGRIPEIETRERSIAILPFRIIGSDRRTDDMVAGLAAGLPAALAMISDLYVISGGTTLDYQNSALSPRQIARRLRVRHILEGSVQISANQVKVTASLMDAEEGQVLWSQFYERPAPDIITVQNDITLDLLTALQVELTEGEQARIRPITATRNVEAWLLAGQALQVMRRISPQDVARARSLYKQVLKLDPDYSSAATGLAWTHTIDLLFGWSSSPGESLALVSETASELIQHEAGQAPGYCMLAIAELMRGHHSNAETYGRRAMTAMPASADFTAIFAFILTFTGKYDQAADLMERAIRLSPARHDWHRWNLARAHRLAGRPQEALALLRQANEAGSASPIYHLELTATLATLDRNAEARQAARDVMRSQPNFSVNAWTASPSHYNSGTGRHERELLLSAGLPE